MKEIGEKIKELRLQKGLTLRELGELTSLSAGYLSQIERGKSTLGIDNLATIAMALETNANYLISEMEDIEQGNDGKILMKSYERKMFLNEKAGKLSYSLINSSKNKTFFPRIVELVPGFTDRSTIDNSHEGEEFIYVLEGIFTLKIDNIVYDMYPGDAIYFDSSLNHIWSNNTPQMVRVLTVNSPNPFSNE